MKDWNWSESTDEEFDFKRKTQTYYRIFHKEDQRAVVDYKFWADADTEALNVLNEFKSEHDDGNEYFYSTSGYYLNHDGKRFDTMHEMHEEFIESKKDCLTEDDIEYYSDNFKNFKEEITSEKRKTTLSNLKNKLFEIMSSIDKYEKESSKLLEDIQSIDVKLSDQNTLDDIEHVGFNLENKYYELFDIEHVLKTNHYPSETWDLIDHVIEDLKFNIKNMLDKTNGGYPSSFIDKAAKALNVEYKHEMSYSEDEAEKAIAKNVSEKAALMWKEEMNKFYDTILGYMYFSDFGIVDDKDEQMKKYDEAHSMEVPRKPGTDKEIDYVKNHDIVESKWNFICDWMKEHGRDLWI